MNKPDIHTRKSPISIGLCSTSQIKVDALVDAINRARINASVTAVKGSESGVNEQPVGEAEILRGATNRAMTARAINAWQEVYIAIENGIQQERNDWVDYAIVLASVPGYGAMGWVRSQAVTFPSEAVEFTANKEGGFVLNTVGKTLAELGFVQQHDDPHFELSGIHRKDILCDALVELFNYLPTGLFLRSSLHD